jgi:sulfur carrier protein
MKVVVNGEARALQPGATVADVVRSLDLGGERGSLPRGVAVALDGEVVIRGEWSSTVLAEGARIEVLGAIGGGR